MMMNAADKRTHSYNIIVH